MSDMCTYVKVWRTIILVAITLLVFWGVFYIPHAMGVTDLFVVWWGCPYFITAALLIIASWAGSAILIEKMWRR